MIYKSGVGTSFLIYLFLLRMEVLTEFVVDSFHSTANSFDFNSLHRCQLTLCCWYGGDTFSHKRIQNLVV